MTGQVAAAAGLLHRFVAQDERRSGGSYVDFAALSGHLRCLLVTDGTVSSLIEAFSLEPTRTRCLEQKPGHPTQPELRWLAATPGTVTVLRRVLIEGALTRQPYLSARSLLVPERLPDEVVDVLADERSSIGAALVRSGVEHRRELLWFERRQGAVASRTYRIFIRGVPAILINEDFLR